ncbi:MAG: ammonia-forming cytochrome c nitrite reductase subunit c552 [Candidatus Firestonebacteria bacterium]|nr:ammonia-forming cytochrome c nitrite reductase subunit c552 [Candidatus Firestonebacteria bacterium]
MIEWIKNNLALAVVIAIVVGTVAFVGGIKVADQPFFCGMLCHEMQPHVDSLEANFHGKNGVTCMDCHSEQGFINHAIEHAVSAKLMIPHITKVYLEDEHGLHKDIAGFNHEEMNYKGKVDTEAEQELFKKCMACHPDRLSKSYFMKANPHMEITVTENCKRCHEEIAKSKVEDLNEAKKLLTDFSKPLKIANVHPLHIDRHIGEKEILCVACHNRVVHSNNPQVHIPGMEMCFRCHNKGGKAPEVECKGCHLGQANLFAGIEGKDVDQNASFMADIGCADCHSNDMKFDIQACVGCHDDSYKDKLKEYKDSYKTKYDNVKKVYDEVQESVKMGKTLGQAEALYNKASFNFKYAELDGSKGMHNPDFTSALLDKSLADLEEVKKALK